MRYYRCQSATLIRARRPVHSTRPAMLSVRTLGVQFYTDSVESMGADSFCSEPLR